VNICYYFTIPRLYPIWILAVSCIMGIWWQSFEYPWYFTLAMTITLSTFLMVWRNRCLALKTIYIILYATIFIASCRSYQRSIDRQQKFCDYTHNHRFDVTGKVIDITQTGNVRLPWSIKLKIHTLACNDCQLEPWKHPDVICLTTRQAPGFSISDTITIKNVLFKTPKNKEFLRYLIKEEIVTSVTIDKNQQLIITHPYWTFNRWLAGYRQTLLDSFQQSMTKQTYLSFGSIFLGNPVTKKGVEEMKSQLKMWGLFHYIARAGLHLVIFISIWMFILSFLPVAWLWRQLLMMALAGIYFIFTWPSIPFNRAFFTFILTKTFTIFGCRSYYIPSLSVILLVTLLAHPIYLFCLDFQLSFGITYALAWFNEIRAQKYS